MGYTDPYAPPADSTLRLLLERCADDTVDDERVRRVLEPVLRMIQEGRFARRWNMRRAAKPVAVAAAVVITTAGIARYGGGGGALFEIPPPSVPLSGSAVSAALSGRVILKGAGLGGIELRLLTEDGETIATAVTDENGVYGFTDVPNGSYLLSAALPPGIRLADDKTSTAVDIKDPSARKDITAP